MDRPHFASRAEYAARFTDPGYWQPYVEAVCARHGLGSCAEIRVGLPGTHAVFLVDGRYVVKLYSSLFGHPAEAADERALYAVFATAPGLPVPALVAGGDLFPAEDGWPWPYLVTTVVPGVSFGEAVSGMTDADKIGVASWLGPVVRAFHALPPPGGPRLAPTWDAFGAFLDGQRAACVANHRRWGSLPASLLAQLDAYLPPIADLVDWTAGPHLLHGDLTADHVLGQFGAGRWQPAGLIDFGDARTGDRGYEWVALHLDLFGADKRLLRAFFRSYGGNPATDPAWPRRALSFTILHEFDVLGPVFARFPAARAVTDLPALATLLWDLDAPGVS